VPAIAALMHSIARQKLEVHSAERIYLRQRCLDASKPRVAAAARAQYGFSDVIKFRVAVHTLWEKEIRFQHPDYDPDRAQKLISLYMSRHLSTRNISSKFMHAFLSRVRILTRVVDIAILSECPSVCPLVTFRYQMKTA